MKSQIVAVFCLCDDIFNAFNHHEDQECQMNDSEVMTTAIAGDLECYEVLRLRWTAHGHAPLWGWEL